MCQPHDRLETCSGCKLSLSRCQLGLAPGLDGIANRWMIQAMLLRLCFLLTWWGNVIWQVAKCWYWAYLQNVQWPCICMLPQSSVCLVHTNRQYKHTPVSISPAVYRGCIMVYISLVLCAHKCNLKSWQCLAVLEETDRWYCPVDFGIRSEDVSMFCSSGHEQTIYFVIGGLALVLGGSTKAIWAATNNNMIVNNSCEYFVICHIYSFKHQ